MIKPITVKLESSVLSLLTREVYEQAVVLKKIALRTVWSEKYSDGAFIAYN